MFWRVTAGFLIAPLAVSLGMALTIDLKSNSLQDQATEFLLIAIVFYIYPLVFAIIFALPMYLFLNHFGLVRWWTSLIAGLLVGGVGAASLVEQSLWLGIRLIVLGGIAGLIFWHLISTYKPPKAKW